MGEGVVKKAECAKCLVIIGQIEKNQIDNGLYKLHIIQNFVARIFDHQRLCRRSTCEGEYQVVSAFLYCFYSLMCKKDASIYTCMHVWLNITKRSAQIDIVNLTSLQQTCNSDKAYFHREHYESQLLQITRKTCWMQKNKL